MFLLSLTHVGRSEIEFLRVGLETMTVCVYFMSLDSISPIWPSHADLLSGLFLLDNCKGQRSWVTLCHGANQDFWLDVFLLLLLFLLSIGNIFS